MKTRLEKWEKHRQRIASAPDWTFKLHEILPSKHSFDEKVMAGKTIGSKAIVAGSEKKAAHPLAYESYKQRKQILSFLKYTLFAVAIILLVVLYVIWVR